MGNLSSDPDFATPPDDGGDGWGNGGNDDLGDLHIGLASSCLNRGSPGTPSAPTDFDGDPRHLYCRVDIGFDEATHIGLDCNGNSEPDVCDVNADPSLDCNDNYVVDACELDGNDCNG